MIEPESLEQVDRVFVRWRGRKLVYFGGCDYFRLSSHPGVLAAAAKMARKSGLSASASRLTTGNHPVFARLERELEKFFDAETALVVSAGYLAPMSVAQGLRGMYSHVVIDSRAHPALVDAAGMFDCPVLKFEHRNVSSFALTIDRCGREAKVIVLTDGMFPHDGSIAPLREYLRILPRAGKILVDDAHGAGVLGRKGQGTIEFEGASRDRVIQCFSLSKAFGVSGGVVLCPRGTRRSIVERSGIIVGTTPLALPLAFAALESARILRRDKSLRRRLNRNVARVKEALASAGFETGNPASPIISIQCENDAEKGMIKRRLVTAGVFPSLISYPGGPVVSYFRFAISSEHSVAQCEALVRAIVDR